MNYEKDRKNKKDGLGLKFVHKLRFETNRILLTYMSPFMNCQS